MRIIHQVLFLISFSILTFPCLAETTALNVRDFGAKGDGKADDTPAFQKAVQQAKVKQQPVLIPRGSYRLNKPIVLENVGVTGPEVGAWNADTDTLPILLPQHRDAPCITLRAGGSIKGLCIRYDWAKEPEAGPPAISVKGVGAYLSSLKIMYPWDGIMTDGVSNVGRLNIENVFMVSPRNIGVRVTGTWDIPTLRNIEVWNAGPVARPLAKGIGFDLGKNDLIRMSECFAFAMQTGFLLRDEIPGCKIKGGTWGIMNGCATDFCSIGIEVRGENTVSISGGTFWNHHTSLIVDGDKARVRMTGAELKSNGASVVEVRQADQAVISGCSLIRTLEGHSPPAVRLMKGRTTLTGCHLQSLGEGIVISDGVASAVLQGNTLETVGKAVINQSSVQPAVQIFGNSESRYLPPSPDKKEEKQEAQLRRTQTSVRR